MNNNFEQTLKWCLRALLLFVFICGSCSKDDVSGEETPPVTANRARTEQGKSLGVFITKRIGKEGGTIELPTQGISLTIPPDAVQEDTAFGIEMITNTNPASVGVAYRLTPANITFSKPVAIHLSTQKINDEISVPDALALAYQTNEGYWNMLEGKKTKDINGELTAITTHLGDVGPMQWLFLRPVQGSVLVDKSIELEAIRYIPAPTDPEDFLVVPLVSKKEGEEIPVLNPIALETKYIKKWELDGPGTLTPNGNKAKYKALPSVLSGSAAAVSVELKTKSYKVLLVSNLKITTDEYLKIRVNGGPTIDLIGVANYIDNAKTIFGIAGVMPNDNTNIPFVVTGKTQKGSYLWDDSNIGGDSDTDATLSYKLPSGGHYQETYEPGNGIPYAASPGSLQILEIGKVGEYVTGKFSATRVGFYDAANKYQGTGKIEGEFKLLLLDVGNYNE